MMNQQEYIAATKDRGALCPNCGGRDLSFRSLQVVDTTEVYQDVICHSCDATWADYYTLAGYDNLDAPEPSDD